MVWTMVAAITPYRENYYVDPVSRRDPYSPTGFETENTVRLSPKGHSSRDSISSMHGMNLQSPQVADTSHLSAAYRHDMQVQIAAARKEAMLIPLNFFV